MKTPIRRAKPLFEFVQVPNLVARDYRLSFRARGLLLELLSYPPGWETTVDEIVERAKRESEKHGGKMEGREAMRAAARELVQFEYIRRRKYQNDLGHWQTECWLSDEPLLAIMMQQGMVNDGTDAQDPVSGLTSGNAGKPAGHTEDGFPGVGFPDVGFLGVTRNTDTNTVTKKTDDAPSARSAPGRPKGTTGSSARGSSGSAASGKNKPRLTKDQHQTIDSVRQMLPVDLDRALPVKTPRNVADAILEALAEGQPHGRTPQQLLQHRLLARWDRYWAAEFYAGRLPKQPIGPVVAMLAWDPLCGSKRCDERVDVDTGQPCPSCAMRSVDRRADRASRQAEGTQSGVPAPRTDTRPHGQCPCGTPVPLIAQAAEDALCHECRQAREAIGALL